MNFSYQERVWMFLSFKLRLEMNGPLDRQLRPTSCGYEQSLLYMRLHGDKLGEKQLGSGENRGSCSGVNQIEYTCDIFSQHG